MPGRRIGELAKLDPMRRNKASQPRAKRRSPLGLCVGVLKLASPPSPRFLSFVSVISGLLVSSQVLAQTSEPQERTLPNKMSCQALQTVGLHDYEGAPESYEASTFFESKFELRINKVLTRHLAASGSGAAEATPDLFLTLRAINARPIDLRCRQIQGLGGELGFSCSNTPPSELLLINPQSLRFTRTSIGGWTFADRPAKSKNNKSEESQGNLGDDSLFVEYGNCEAVR